LLGQVVRVAEGDSFTIIDAGKQEHAVRLAGIDAPNPGQSYSEASALHLAGLLAGKRILVDYTKEDRHGRLVGKVFYNCMNINFAQIQAGFAWHDVKDAHEQSATDTRLYATAELGARKASSGLWKERNPIAPWKWRHGMRTLTSNP
jgi:endonuclease YncB( thermonuclease family)